jgi:hypothetical protein
MTPDQLERRLPLALLRLRPEESPDAAAELGARLKQEYCDRADFFRQIIHCAGRARQTGDTPTSFIHLGDYNHPDARIGRIRSYARLSLHEYNPAMRESSFGVVTTFLGDGPHGALELAKETFGGANFRMVDSSPPTFIINPNTTCEEPWDIGFAAVRRHPINHHWSMEAYRDIYNGLAPMLSQAADTQAMLLAAMQDDVLNPGMAEAARDLTLPGFAA